MNSGKILLVSAVLTFLIAGAALRQYLKTRVDRARTYSVGFDVRSRPFHFADSKGQPDGLAVSLVREAARRSGISLTWREISSPGIDAIRKGEVDFWVLMTDLPERRRLIHFTEPFLSTEYCFLVLDSSPFRNLRDLSRARISSPGSGIDRILLASLAPDAAFAFAGTGERAFDALAKGSADAVFLDQYAAGDLALTGHLVRRTRIVPARVPRGYLGLVSSFGTAPAADAIREEMRSMSADGTMAEAFETWGFLPGLNREAIDSLEVARSREKLLLGGVLVLLLLLIFAAALAIRLNRRQQELKKVESALRESEAYHRTLIDLLPDSIYVLPAQSGSQPGGPAYRPVGHSDPALDWLVASPSHQEAVRLAEESGERTAADVVSPDGRSLEYRLVPLRETAGGVMGVLHDRTDRQRAENARAELEEQLRQAQKLDSLGQLAGGVAHDFNNLLTIIMGYSQILLDNRNLAPCFAEAAGQISAAAERAAGLTRQLLTFSRRDRVSPRTFSLDSLAKGTELMLRRLVEEHIEIVLSPASGALVYADPGLIEQVIVNLAVNARDAMPSGGAIYISTSRVEVADDFSARCLSVPIGIYVSLEVTDSGSGMSPEVQARIFEPFFTTKEPGKGTGLGLSTVHGIVKQSGGFISVHSAPGIGTSFRVLLPAVNSAPDEEMPLPAAMPARGTETVLLVEDEPGVRAYVRDLLTGHGYRVLAAGSGEEAFEMLRREGGEVDLLLTDVVLPGMSGIEVIRNFRASHPCAPALCMSGYAKQFGASLSAEVPYIQKPFAPVTLLSRIREVLGGASQPWRALPASGRP